MEMHSLEYSEQGTTVVETCSSIDFYYFLNDTINIIFWFYFTDKN